MKKFIDWLKQLRLEYLPLFLGPAILLSPLWINNKVLFWGTPALQFIPWWNYAWESLKSGVLPLWNPLNGMGAPLIANYQFALFYPPNWLLLLLAGIGGVRGMYAAGIAWGDTILVIIHLVWAGLGMSLLMKKLGYATLGQVISGMAFGLSGYLVARIGFFSMIWTGAWLPWIILTASQIASPVRHEKKDFHYKQLFPLIICLTLQLLAGHAQLAWYTLLLTVAWVFVGGFIQNGFHWALKAILYLAPAVIAAILLAGIQLFPTVEYLLQSQRSNSVNYQVAMTYSFWPWRFLTFIAPDLFGNPGLGDYWGYASFWEDDIYIGLFPLILSVITIPCIFKKAQTGDASRNSRSLIIFLWSLVLVAIILALGSNTPVFPFLYRNIPTFDMFNAPARYMIWCVFALSMLAGIGTSFWWEVKGRGLYWLRLSTAGAFSITLGAFIGWYLKVDIKPTFIRAAALTGLWAVGCGALCLLIPKNMNTDQKGEYKRQFKQNIWQWTVLLWVLADLLVAGWYINPGVDASIYQKIPDPVKILTGEHRLYISSDDEYNLKFNRFLRFWDYRPIEDWRNLVNVLLPDTNLLEEVNSANNFDPLVPGRYAGWMSAINVIPMDKRIPLLTLMDVNVVESVDTTQPLGVKFTSIEGAERFRWFSCSLPVKNPDKALNQVITAASEGKLFDRIIVEGDAGGEDCGGSGITGVEIEVIQSRADGILLKTNSPVTGWLMMADTWYPGWQVRIDNNPAPIYRADYLFRAVKLSPGEHEIEFHYYPMWFYIGCGTSVLGCLTLLFVVTFFSRRVVSH